MSDLGPRFANQIPLIWPKALALEIILERTSNTIMNKYGDRGSPCLRPLKSLKEE